MMGTEESLEANESITPHGAGGSGYQNIKWAVKYVFLPSIGFALAYWLSFLWLMLDLFSPLVLIIPAWLSDLMQRVPGLPFVSEILFLLPVHFLVLIAVEILILSLNVSHAQEVFSGGQYDHQQVIARGFRLLAISIPLSILALLSMMGAALVFSRAVSPLVYQYIMIPILGIVIGFCILILSSYASSEPAEFLFRCVSNIWFWSLLLALTAIFVNTTSAFISVAISEVWQYYPADVAMARWLPSVLLFSLALAFMAPMYPVLLAHFGNRND
jgi:hypothetical protein